jgi:hypothetical protein
MKRDWKSWFWRSAAQVFLGGVGLVLVTFLCFQLELNLATTGLFDPHRAVRNRQHS